MLGLGGHLAFVRNSQYLCRMQIACARKDESDSCQYLTKTVALDPRPRSPRFWILLENRERNRSYEFNRTYLVLKLFPRSSRCPDRHRYTPSLGHSARRAGGARAAPSKPVAYRSRPTDARARSL